MRFLILVVLLAAFQTTTASAVAPTVISIDLTLTRPGVQSQNVVERSLYFASTDRPIYLGPKGIGSFSWGSVQLPFEVPSPDDYHLVLAYALATENMPRLIEVRIDGAVPHPSWSGIKLWPTSPNYPWGSRHLRKNRWPAPLEWAISAPVTLASGTHTLELVFEKGDLMITGAYLTNGAIPANPTQPWFQTGYVPFPALNFTDRVVERGDDSLRITFHGQLHNLAPDPVNYTVETGVMPRNGNSNTRFHVVDASPGSSFQLEKGGSLPFSLTVEATGAVPPDYSEIVRYDLISSDVENLSKPYLMTTSMEYLDVRIREPFHYAHGNRLKDIVPVNDDTAQYLIPSRETLHLVDGDYGRTLTEAFVYGLLEAPAPIELQSGLDLVNWARTSPEITITEQRDFQFDRRHPLAILLAALGTEQGSLETLRQAMLLLTDEMPFYPVYRWDMAQPAILPTIQFERTGAVALASYIKLIQHDAMNTAEHFRFLHNVILPLFLSYRDDLRIGGTLAQAAKAGDTVLSLDRATPPNIFPEDFVADWLRIGEGANTEYIRIQQRHGGQVDLAANFPGPLQYDHDAGEPWVSFTMREWLVLEAKDTWSLFALAVASRDSAVIESMTELLNIHYRTQYIFREDGSFANEPGSYGWSAFTYIEQIEQIINFLGRENFVAFDDQLATQIRNALIMWNDFAFSDGTYPHLNRGGGNPQLPRRDAFDLLQSWFPEEQELISQFDRIITQEKERIAGSPVDNHSFKVDGWGYALLRGPGSWDQRMETLLSSKQLLKFPGDHVSRDTLGLMIFAHGAQMTPRYGYDWRGYPFLLLNMARIDHEEPIYWGDFLHFDDHPDLPSAVAYTDMAGSWSTEPGIARQERWVIQLPDYLFDTYFIRPRDGQAHTFEWGYRNLGTLTITNPKPAPLNEALNVDGSAWDPFGYYISNSGNTAMEFITDDLWQGVWTMDQGNIGFGAEYPNPPRGAQMRLTMVAEPQTRVIQAPLDGPGRGNPTLQQDFVVVERQATETVFTSLYEPVAVGQTPHILHAETIAEQGDGQARVIRVTTTAGEDWFLVGTEDFHEVRSPKRIGPFLTNAALALVRVRDQAVVEVMFAGGESLVFDDGTTRITIESDAAIYHAPDRSVSLSDTP